MCRISENTSSSIQLGRDFVLFSLKKVSIRTKNNEANAKSTNNCQKVGRK